MTDAIEKLNWKTRKKNTYDALASRIVGGKYFIYWHEGYCSEQTCEWVEVRAYSVEYQTKGGGGIGNVSQFNIHTMGCSTPYTPPASRSMSSLSDATCVATNSLRWG